ncbi:hypothetical protein JCM16161A_22960 [Vulcanisaeta sp. JCM 16161]
MLGWAVHKQRPKQAGRQGSMSIRDCIKPLNGDSLNHGVTCIRVIKNYGDWEVELDVCIELP